MTKRARASFPRGRNGDFISGLGTIVSKVSERYKTVDESGSTPTGLESVIRDLPVGFMLSNREGEILDFNVAAQRILGLEALDVGPNDRTRVYGCHLSDTVTPFPADQLPLARALRGEVATDVEIFIRNQRVPSGVWISASSAPWRDEDGGVSGGVVVFRDITGEKSSVIRRHSGPECDVAL